MKQRQKGYSIVEIGIVVVVISLMTSYLAVNYQRFHKTQQNQQAERQIESIKAAIVNYAARNTTSNRFVEVINSFPVAGVANTVQVRWTLPAGRPYLPCPDVTGDGEEDRMPPLTTALTINLSAGAGYNLGDYPLEISGGCHSDRGSVPWRTLNTPAADVWGNRYTYRVMPSFSNALVGFDQNFRADSRLYRPLVAGVDGTIRSQPAYAATVSIPTMVTLTPWQPGTLKRYIGPSIVCASAPCPIATTLVLGTLTTGLAGRNTLLIVGKFQEESVIIPQMTDFDGNFVADYQDDTPTEGVPFVVLSHGQNGYGAVRSDVPGFFCNPFPPATGYDDEKQNALWYASVSTTVAIGDNQYTCTPPTNLTMVFDINHVGIGVVDGINHGTRIDESGLDLPGLADGYDDIVGWMSVGELMHDLGEREVLPVRLLPPIGLEK